MPGDGGRRHRTGTWRRPALMDVSLKSRGALPRVLHYRSAASVRNHV